MATSRIIVPLLNPVKFIELEPAIFPKYLSRHFDDFFFMETIKPYEQRVQFAQPWMNVDTIFLQFRSSYDPMKITLLNYDEREFLSEYLTQGAADVDDASMHIYEAAIPLSGYTEDIYFLRLDCGDPDGVGNFPLTLISEPLHISQIQKETLLLSYRHFEFKGNVVFETGIPFNLRLKAALRFKAPLSKDTFFEDQPLGMSMLESKPYRLYNLSIGGAKGIPDYMADMVNRILGCSELYIDGKPYAKSDGSKMEESTAPGYPMRGWNVDIREAENVSALTFSTSYILREDGGYMLREDGTSKFMRER